MMLEHARWTALSLSLLVACSDAGAAALALGPASAARASGARGGGGGSRSLTVSPSRLTLEVGQSAPLSASILDRKGEVSSDRAAWTSDAPAIASVDGAGVVTARAAGAAAVVATWRNVADTAWVEVVDDGSSPPPPPPAPSLVLECDTPRAEWIWCDDFETDRLASYFEHNDHGGDFVRASGVGLDGSAGMRASWAEGQVSGGWLHVAFGRTPGPYFAPVDAGQRDYRDVYWRFFIRYDDDWTGGGGSKMTRARIFHAQQGWVQAMQAPVWSGDPPYTDVVGLDPVSYTDAAGAVTGTPRWLGHQEGAATIFSDADVGPWYCIEAHVRLNDAGAANGEFQVWIDGEPDARRTGLNWVGAYDDFGLNTVTLENYWNAGSPRAQARYFDNLVVGTAPIGCG